MTIAAPLLIAGVLAAACGLGFCVVGGRLLKGTTGQDGHCARPGQGATLWERLGPIVFSALACGLGMFVVLYFLPGQ
jgi:hypothetical protein